MIPVCLRLSGFLSYQEPVELDFNQFDIACISGSNGAGKSSLLDAFTWALFGKARRVDDSIINSSKNVKAAEVVLDFKYEGNLYRVQRTKPREKTTVLELFILGESNIWRPLTERSVRETEQKIQTILRMDYDSFINASFFLQGKADQFAQQRPGDRKKVLSTILGLEVWEEYKTAAAERRKNVEVELKTLDSHLEEIESELSQEQARKTRLVEVEDRLAVLSQMRQSSEATLAALQRQATILTEQYRMVEMLEKNVREARQAHQRLSANLDELIEERSAYQQRLANQDQVRARYAHWQELRLELERWDKVAENFRETEARRSAPLTEISAEESGLVQEGKSLTNQELQISKQQARLPDLENQIEEISKIISALEETLAARPEFENTLQERVQKIADARAENATLKEAMQGLKERIDRLNEVSGAVCPVCGQPLSQDERAKLISSLELEGKEMGDRFRANLDLVARAENQVRETQASVEGLKKAEEELRGQVRLHERLEAEWRQVSLAIAEWREGNALRLAEVNRMLADQDFALDARQRLAVIDAELRSLGYDSAAHDADRREEADVRSSERELLAIEAVSASLGPLERQISGLETQTRESEKSVSAQERTYQDARSRYEEEAAQLPDVNKVEREVFASQSEENRLRMEVGMVRQSVAVLDKQRERKTRLTAQRGEITHQIARFKLLEKAFSKDGVPAILIEQALPEIETQANELLERLSNGNMSVRFATQKPYKDKTKDDKRETLDIIISDSAGEREYELFSGGESFRVNFAIRLALSRVLAQRAGARLQTLVIDEGFGSQDADGKQRLIEAIHLVQPEFAKILVVTHLEELKEVFPARIEVEKTISGSQVRVLA